MTRTTRTVIDVDSGVYTEHLDLKEVFQGPNGPVPFRITKRRLYGGTSDGVDIIEVDNGRLSFVIVPTRGMGIWRGRCGDVELKWDSPVHGPVHPKLVPNYAPNGIGWLEGFDEWLVRCGLENNGAPEFNEHGALRWPLHGRIANIPARKVDVTLDPQTGEITVQGVVEETSLFTKRMTLTVTYTTFAGSNRLEVTDKVTNLSSEPAEFELLYHINTGRPFVTPGARVVVPFHEMSPRDGNAVSELDGWDIYQPERVGRPETCFLFDMATDASRRTKVLLINEKNNRGICIGFNKKQFPHFLIWKLQRPNGDTYVTAMEPCINFPNTRSFEKAHGRVATLEPGQSRLFEIAVEVLTDPEDVSRTAHEIEALMDAPGRVLPRPNPDWAE